MIYLIKISIYVKLIYDMNQKNSFIRSTFLTIVIADIKETSKRGAFSKVSLFKK